MEAGPYIDVDEAEGFLNHMSIIAKQFDVLTFSGSLPKGLAANYYQDLITMARAYGSKVVLDCSGAPLKAVLAGRDKPTVIKPNLEELEALLGEPITLDEERLVSLLSQPLFEGIEWIIISLGAQGLLLNIIIGFIASASLKLRWLIQSVLEMLLWQELLGLWQKEMTMKHS